MGRSSTPWSTHRSGPIKFRQPRKTWLDLVCTIPPLFREGGIISLNLRKNRGSSIVESPGAILTERLGELQVRMAASGIPSAGVIAFLRESNLRILFLSVVLVIPCVWHRHIEAGDLASHVYNAWLAQLIEKGQAPGLYLVSRWNNVLFDITLLHLGKVFGFPVAEKIAVYVCVLIFFWGVFAFVAAVTERAPWFLAPCIAMLTYGYSFNMGFMNYYLSLGLACFSLALFWAEPGWG